MCSCDSYKNGKFLSSMNHGDTQADAEQVVVEYAVYLGIDVRAEGHLLWIAEEGLRAPLPEGFTEHADADGTPFFVSAATGESSWEHPLDQVR